MAIVKRLLKMHNSTGLLLPKPLCRALGLHPGDYVYTVLDMTDTAILIRKLNLKETPHDGATRDPAEPDRRRRT